MNFRNISHTSDHGYLFIFAYSWYHARSRGHIFHTHLTRSHPLIPWKWITWRMALYDRNCIQIRADRRYPLFVRFGIRICARLFDFAGYSFYRSKLLLHHKPNISRNIWHFCCGMWCDSGWTIRNCMMLWTICMVVDTICIFHSWILSRWIFRFLWVGRWLMWRPLWRVVEGD